MFEEPNVKEHCPEFRVPGVIEGLGRLFEIANGQGNEEAAVLIGGAIIDVTRANMEG